MRRRPSRPLPGSAMLAACAWLLSFCLLAGCTPVIVDSALSPQQAIYENQPPDIPADVQQQLVVVKVRYYGFDQQQHQGQVVVHKALAQDVRAVFTVIWKTRFPLESLLPIAHPLIQSKGPYGLSPDTNNSSAFVWRPMVGSHNVSLHGLGLAIDLNPRLNPYRKGEVTLPPGAAYHPAVPGTLTPDSPVVLAFKKLGWQWGGDWGARGKVDYMHFQKIPADLASWVRGYRE